MTEKAVNRRRRNRGGDDQRGEVASAVQLAVHLDCSRSYLHKLEAAGVIHRVPGGFDLRHSRTNYIRYLRRERQQSPRTAAEAEFLAARTKLPEIKAAEKLGQFMSREGFENAIDDVVGIFLTGLSSMPARIGRGDLLLRRRVETEVYEVRRSVSRACTEKLTQKQVDWTRDDAEKAATNGN